MIGALFKPDPLIRQSEAGECGLACLAMVARHYRDRTSLVSMRRRFRPSSRGTTLLDLIGIAEQLGFHARGLRCEPESLDEIATPAILHWDLNHFVVLDQVRRHARGTRFVILDPAKGRYVLSREELSEHFTGVALELLPGSSFKPAKDPERLRLNQLWTRIVGFWPALGRILALSVIMQLIVLAMPFYMRVAIDTALPAMDLDLLQVLAIGFAGILVMNALISLVRTRLVLNLSLNLSLQTAINLFRHTMFLPAAWFERRYLGDVISRFGSLEPVADLLSRGLVSSVVDGALALTTLVLMAIYAPVLASLAVGVVGLYGLVRVLGYQALKRANTNVLTAQALENSAFIESVRGVNTIKVFCQEGSRQHLWQNRKAEFVNGSLRLGRLNAGFDAINVLVVGLENIMFGYLAIKMVVEGSFTLGLAFAFQAYKASFVGAATRLIDQLLAFRLLDVHLSRVAEIALEAPESRAMAGYVQPFSTITLDNVSYSYGFGLPPVLHNVSLTIPLDGVTAIVGPSGSGKTTLFKILCGLLQPTSGRVLIDSVALEEFGLRNYRRQLGVVSQDDMLFAGTIADNVAFFDPGYSVEGVVICCKSAGIHDDIERMPMKYETMVGDMGASLSGGQRQRVLIARALYRKPRVLVLDESTAHLDLVSEQTVMHSLDGCGIPRIIIAHRPDAVRAAHRRIFVDAGRAQLEACPSTEWAPLEAASG